MSKTYRIKEYITFYGSQYLVQRKSIFGFWYNPDNVDGYTTGWYNSLADAREAIKAKLTPTKITIINQKQDE